MGCNYFPANRFHLFCPKRHLHFKERSGRRLPVSDVGYMYIKYLNLINKLLSVCKYSQLYIKYPDHINNLLLYLFLHSQFLYKIP